jgi:hypothetical protein
LLLDWRFRTPDVKFLLSQISQAPDQILPTRPAAAQSNSSGGDY